MDDDVEAVTDLVRGVWVGLCLRAMVDLGLADQLRQTRTPTELAERTGCPPRQLRRLLVCLRDAGLVLDPEPPRPPVALSDVHPVGRPRERPGARRWSLTDRAASVTIEP